MHTDDYSYQLPPERIAQYAHQPAHKAKMLHCHQTAGKRKWTDTSFDTLPYIVDSSSVFVYNNSQVIRARIPLHNIEVERTFLPKHHAYHTRILKNQELFVYNIISESEGVCEVLSSGSQVAKPGSIIHMDGECHIQSLAYTQDGVRIRIHGMSLQKFLKKYAQIPLPPYITYKPEKEQSYQTDFGKKPGSVAAPTAGLHFTDHLRTKLSQAGIQQHYITLHIGLGTFKPLHSQNIHHVQDYIIHKEKALIPHELWSQIPLRHRENRSIIAIGTTALRTIESLPIVRSHIDQSRFPSRVQDFRNKRLPQDIPKKGNNSVHKVSSNKQHTSFFTQLYITPPYKLRITHGLITNFHLPQTSLLVLIHALMGKERRQAYQHALNTGYMFYSLGDGMFVDLRNNR